MFLIPEGAACRTKSLILCDYENVLDNEEVTKDLCKNCGKVKLYNKVDGRIDNKKYADDHLRDFLQPYGAMKGLFFKIYGTKGFEEATKHTENKRRVKNGKDQEELREYTRETFKIAKRLDDQGRL